MAATIICFTYLRQKGWLLYRTRSDGSNCSIAAIWPVLLGPTRSIGFQLGIDLRSNHYCNGSSSTKYASPTVPANGLNNGTGVDPSKSRILQLESKITSKSFSLQVITPMSISVSSRLASTCVSFFLLRFENTDPPVVRWSQSQESSM